MRVGTILLTLAASVTSLAAGAQSVHNVRINEVLILNEANAIDDYGEHNAWIELFNAGYENANIGGCYIKVRYANPINAADSVKIYSIPRGDDATKMSPQSYLLFYCEGTDTKGTFYTNFTFGEGEVMSLELLNANGKDILNTFEFPKNHIPQADISWGWENKGNDDKLVFGALSRTTPNATNDMPAEITKDELFKQRDPWGVIMLVIAMSVVMLTLVLISFILKLMSKISTSHTAKTDASKQVNFTLKTKAEETLVQSDVENEISAAISTAIALSLSERHINEAGFITIKNSSKQNRI